MTYYLSFFYHHNNMTLFLFQGFSRWRRTISPETLFRAQVPDPHISIVHVGIPKFSQTKHPFVIFFCIFSSLNFHHFWGGICYFFEECIAAWQERGGMNWQTFNSLTTPRTVTQGFGELSQGVSTVFSIKKLGSKWVPFQELVLIPIGTKCVPTQYRMNHPDFRLVKIIV